MKVEEGKKWVKKENPASADTVSLTRLQKDHQQL